MGRLKRAFQKCGQLRQQRVETPILRKVTGTNGIDGGRRENCLPWVHHFLFALLLQRCLNVAQFVRIDESILVGSFAHNQHPGYKPNASDCTEHIEETFPAVGGRQQTAQWHRNNGTSIIAGKRCAGHT